MPGPSSSTCSSRSPLRAATPTTTRRRRVLQRVLDEVGDDLREPFAGRRRPGTASPPSTSSATPSSAAAGRRPRPRRARPRPRRPGAVQRELVRVEPGEVEQVGDEAFEAAGLATRSRRRRGSRGVGAVDGAVGDRLGVAVDRRERRAQVVRDAEQERALVAARASSSSAMALIARARLAELVVGDVGRGRPAPRGRRRRSTARSSPSRRAAGSAGGRGTRRPSAATTSAMAAATSTAAAAAERARVSTCSASTSTGVPSPTGASGRRRTQCCRPARSAGARRAALGVEVVDGHARRAARASAPPVPSERAEHLLPSPLASTATTRRSRHAASC